MSHIPRFLRKGKARRGSLFVVFALLALGVAPSVALGGTNGQQIRVYAPWQQSMMICGTNQNGQHACHYGNVTFPRELIKGWWWVGRVKIYSYAGKNFTDYRGYTTCTVPARSSTDWWYCNRSLGLSGYPVYRRYSNLGGKLYLQVGPNWFWDPLFRRFVWRYYTFGYWDGHYVYKLSDSVGVDINTGQLVVAQSTNHWIIAAGALTGAGACNPAGISWEGIALPVRAVVTSWCGVGGAAYAFWH
jgi:hypothetical protein